MSSRAWSVLGLGDKGTCKQIRAVFVMGTDGHLRREAEAMPVVLSDEVKLTLLS